MIVGTGKWVGCPMGLPLRFFAREYRCFFRKWLILALEPFSRQHMINHMPGNYRIFIFRVIFYFRTAMPSADFSSLIG